MKEMYKLFAALTKPFDAVYNFITDAKSIATIVNFAMLGVAVRFFTAWLFAFNYGKTAQSIVSGRIGMALFLLFIGWVISLIMKFIVKAVFSAIKPFFSYFSDLHRSFKNRAYNNKHDSSFEKDQEEDKWEKYANFKKQWQEYTNYKNQQEEYTKKENQREKYTKKENQRKESAQNDNGQEDYAGKGRQQEHYAEKETHDFSWAVKFFGLNVPYTEKELKKVYYRMQKKYHPDMGGDEAMSKKVNEAYEILKKHIG